MTEACGWIADRKRWEMQRSDRVEEGGSDRSHITGSRSCLWRINPWKFCTRSQYRVHTEPLYQSREMEFAGGLNPMALSDALVSQTKQITNLRNF